VKLAEAREISIWRKGIAGLFPLYRMATATLDEPECRCAQQYLLLFSTFLRQKKQNKPPKGNHQPNACPQQLFPTEHGWTGTAKSKVVCQQRNNHTQCTYEDQSKTNIFFYHEHLLLKRVILPGMLVVSLPDDDSAQMQGKPQWDTIAVLYSIWEGG
jgi:hypothetical protein